MPNYHFEVGVVSRGKGHSVARLANYITGKKLYDVRLDKTFYRQRNDVLFQHVFLPIEAPPIFGDLQYLCTAIEKAEIRRDARTARQFKGSLPNELSLAENVALVKAFVEENFLSCGYAAIVAIHEGKNEADPSRNNPHLHLIITDRTIGPKGFDKLKIRIFNDRCFVEIWRKEWAIAQNLAYERAGLDVRVSHESLAKQGIRDREPTIHLSRVDWQREKQGIRTPAGDLKRAIKARNEERDRQCIRHQNPGLELKLSR